MVVYMEWIFLLSSASRICVCSTYHWLSEGVKDPILCVQGDFQVEQFDRSSAKSQDVDGCPLLRADLQAAVEESPSPDTAQTLFTGFLPK